MTITQEERATRFRSLHGGPATFVIPNPWDIASSKMLAGLGFQALATSSAAAAVAIGRRDGGLTREQALEHARMIVAATDLPVSADLEKGFGDAPEVVAETVRLAATVGLVGCTIEDTTGNPERPLYDEVLAVERIAAAVEAARALPFPFMLTARAHNLLFPNASLDQTIHRLLAFEKAGADVLFAPGVIVPDDLRRLILEVDRPVNVVARPGCPTVPELAELGVRRVSVGAWFAFAALGELVEAATELRDHGTFGYLDKAGIGARTALPAFNTD